jgi:outer membrane receptor protein involved in Fe transport
LIDSIAYAKGSYTAADGDLSSAGSANFRLVDRLPQHLLKAEIGEYNYYRALLAGSLTTGEASALTYGLEYNYYDGPWDQSGGVQPLERPAALGHRR